MRKDARRQQQEETPQQAQRAICEPVPEKPVEDDDTEPEEVIRDQVPHQEDGARILQPQQGFRRDQGKFERDPVVPVLVGMGDGWVTL